MVCTFKWANSFFGSNMDYSEKGKLGPILTNELASSGHFTLLRPVPHSSAVQESCYWDRSVMLVAIRNAAAAWGEPNALLNIRQVPLAL